MDIEILDDYYNDIMNGGHTYYFEENEEDIPSNIKKLKKVLPENLYFNLFQAFELYKMNKDSDLTEFDTFLYDHEKEYIEIINSNTPISISKLTHENFEKRFIDFYESAGKLYDDSNTYKTNLCRKLNLTEYKFMDFLAKDTEAAKTHLNNLIEYTKKKKSIYLMYYLCDILLIFNYRDEIVIEFENKLKRVNFSNYPLTISLGLPIQIENRIKGIRGDLYYKYPNLS